MRSYSRSYLRHLYRAGEILAARALTEHNLFFYASLMRTAQAAIASGTYKTLCRSGWTPQTAESLMQWKKILRSQRKKINVV